MLTKKTLCILAFAVCCTSTLLHATEEVTMMQPEDFAVFPWGLTVGDAEVLKTMRDCGFNLAGFLEPEYLDAVEAAGLKMIAANHNVYVSDAAAQMDESLIAERVSEMIEKVGDHNALFGYYLCDEPGANLYPGLKKWRDAFHAKDPKRPVYINLFPDYATPAQMNVDTYEEYVESFVTTVQPEFISYDHYTLMEDGSLGDSYFLNLETIRAVALRHGLPFWNVVLSNAHCLYAEPTPAGFRFQLYTTLAYGARGISYFTYFAPAIGNYRSAPIDQFGNKTPTWDMLREVNLQLHQIGPVYLTLRSVHVFHHPDVPKGCVGIETGTFLESIHGNNLLIGEFVNDANQPYVMVVNKDLHRSTFLRMQFKDAGDIYFVNPYTGDVMPWGEANHWLAPGQGMLLTCIPAKTE